MRLDIHMAQLHPDTSRSVWQKRIKQGAVTVDGNLVDSPKHEVTGEEQIVVASTHTSPQPINFSVLYEDEDVLVIDKPSGILTHAKGAVLDEYTVADFVSSRTSYKSDTNRPGIVHRLDRDTSGVILTVKNDQTASFIQRQFSNRTVKKHYVAVVDGTLKHDSAIIDLPIARNPKHPSTFRVDAKGKQAETRYERLAQAKNLTLVQLIPKTGRTHQLRVHMAHLGTPIHGDRVYGHTSNRLFLHAQSLELTLPGGKRMTFTSNAPKEFYVPFK